MNDVEMDLLPTREGALGSRLAELDARGLAGLSPDCAFRDSIRDSMWRRAAQERFAVSRASLEAGGAPERRLAGGPISGSDHETSLVGVRITFADLARSLRGRAPGEAPARRSLPTDEVALLARIDARRERLRETHGTFPDSGKVVRDLRDHEE